ncbi:hypothetical protein EASAB2608_00714 [Streptomyces sp. EAS-AB2608]|uniref:Uncharacterized protein n=1 Tax=Streptomyces bangladeshensis TaxID=295352 RepID=A0ABP5NZC4_9ACTN|nr:hypothetical protein EASAB2608_00714 [Streptomyces sp. EAS-AB2608]
MKGVLGHIPHARGASHDMALPAVHAWVAARCTLPGVIAHGSARQGGARPAVPGSGDAPGA